MKQVTLSMSENVYEHVMFFLKKIDKKDIQIKEIISLNLIQKQEIIDKALNSGISNLSIKDIKQKVLSEK